MFELAPPARESRQCRIVALEALMSDVVTHCLGQIARVCCWFPLSAFTFVVLIKWHVLE